MDKIVIALGGNALQDSKGEVTAEEQLKVIKETTKYLADIIEGGNIIVIAHGNGPQVGRIVIQNSIAKDITPAMPLDVCGAMSQGMIGYYLQQALGDELRSRNIEKPVISIITQVVVDKEDTAFKNPTKPIGPFYNKVEAERIKIEKGYVFVEDSGRGYRRVVASPQPRSIVEIQTVKTLIDNNNIVITVGGGGIPVIKEYGKLKGISAVIDKDLASEKLAEDIDADILLILTAVEKVSINFGKQDQIDLDRVSVNEMRNLVKQGHFPDGSMLPKVMAAIKFVESRPGRKAIIASLNKAKEALEGESGTAIHEELLVCNN